MSGEDYLLKLKAVRKMEKDAKDVFGKYLSAMNENNDHEDIVEVLEQKISLVKHLEEQV